MFSNYRYCPNRQISNFAFGSTSPCTYDRYSAFYATARDFRIVQFERTLEAYTTAFAHLGWLFGFYPRPGWQF